MSDFFKFLKSDPREIQADDDVNPVEMAAAVLLIEMARADFEQADLENATIVELLQEYFLMNLEDANELFDEAEEIADNLSLIHIS